VVLPAVSCLEQSRDNMCICLSGHRSQDWSLVHSWVWNDFYRTCHMRIPRRIRPGIKSTFREILIGDASKSVLSSESPEERLTVAPDTAMSSFAESPIQIQSRLLQHKSKSDLRTRALGMNRGRYFNRTIYDHRPTYRKNCTLKHGTRRRLPL
jgi:hypothetical protein